MLLRTGEREYEVLVIRSVLPAWWLSRSVVRWLWDRQGGGGVCGVWSRVRKVILHNAVSACFETDSLAWVELAGCCLAAGFAAEDGLCRAGTVRVAQGEKRKKKEEKKVSFGFAIIGFFYFFTPPSLELLRLGTDSLVQYSTCKSVESMI